MPRGRCESGSASAQVVLATPALVLVVMLVFQFALYEHASHVVTAAAQHGAAAAQIEHGTATVGRQEAERFLRGADRGLLRDPSVEVMRNERTARVVVRAAVVSLVPGITLTVHGEADGPTERFFSRLER